MLEAWLPNGLEKDDVEHLRVASWARGVSGLLGVTHLEEIKVTFKVPVSGLW